jgi:hypothetical protein
MFTFSALVIAGFYLLPANAALRDQYPWYKTGDEIHAEIQSLSTNCPGVQFDLSTRSASDADGTSIDLDVIHLQKQGGAPSKKAFFVFGEHARELISPESGLQMLRDICGQGNSMDQELVNRVMGSTSFVIIPNGNPVSRKKVEAGEFCKRTNEENVDLNRNFGNDHRDNARAGADDEMNPGPSGFSEPESQIIRDLALQEKPDIFLSIHSGAYLLGTPFGYTADRKADDEQQMMEVLKPISEKYCGGGCPFGDLAGMIGYQSKGCDIDYVKEKLDTPFVFTWEIYVGPDIRTYYQDEAASRSEGKEMSAETKQFFWGNQFGFLQVGSESHRQLRGKSKSMMPESAEDPAGCFNQFNPESQAETQDVAENWAQAFLTLCDEVANYKPHAAPAAGQDMATVMDNRSSRHGSSSSASDDSSNAGFDLAAVDKQELKSETKPAAPVATTPLGRLANQATDAIEAAPVGLPTEAAPVDPSVPAASTEPKAPQQTEAAPIGLAIEAAPVDPSVEATPTEPQASQQTAPSASPSDSKAAKVLSALSALNSWKSIGNTWKHKSASPLDKDEEALGWDQ